LSPFLKRDFPRVPLPKNVTQFSSIAALGDELIDLHLGRKVVPAIPKFPKPGSNTVETVNFQPDDNNPGPGRVVISASQYFEGVPVEAWEYTVGGYQVLQNG
jgi:predicted helicase